MSRVDPNFTGPDEASPRSPADEVQPDRVLKLRGHFADDIDGLRLELVEMRQGLRRHGMISLLSSSARIWQTASSIPTSCVLRVISGCGGAS